MPQSAQTQPTQKKPLRERIKELAAQSAPSMVPSPREVPPPPPEKEVEVLPSIVDLVEDRKTRLEIVRLVNEYGSLGEELKPLKKRQKQLSDRLKVLVGKAGIGKAASGDWRINYYSGERSTLKATLLLALGVSVDTISAATEIKSTYTLRITRLDEEDSNGEE